MKNIQRNVIFTGVGYILPMLAALLTIPLMLKYFGVDLYGLYIICISLIGFMNFVDLGVGQAVIKYVSEYEATGQEHKVKPVLDIALMIYIVVGVAVVMLLYVSAPSLSGFLYNDPQKSQLAQTALRITSGALFLSYVNQFFLNVSRAYHRFDVPAVIHNSANISGIILASILLVLGYSLIEVLWGYVLIQSIALTSGYLTSKKVLPEGVHFGLSFDSVIFSNMISFSIYTFIGNFVIALTSRADKLLIGSIIGTEAVTYYQIPYTIVQMANGIIYTLVQILFPRFSELSSLSNKKELLQLYKGASHIVLFISALIAVMLISAGDSFLSLWVSPEFAEKTAFTLQVLALFSFINSNQSVAYWAAQGGGQAKLTAIVLVISATLYGIALFYLGKLYSYNGVAVALYFGLLPYLMLLVWVSRNIGYRLEEFLVHLIATFLAGSLAVYGLAWLNKMIANNLVSILVDVVVGAIAAGIFFWWFWRKKNATKLMSNNPPIAFVAKT